uniref:Uncharacterized protein n=1 Tax=Talaromyces marneffei PM1 TaxID=1077442 RepID=A0A093V5B8_TALMA
MGYRPLIETHLLTRYHGVIIHGIGVGIGESATPMNLPRINLLDM